MTNSSNKPTVKAYRKACQPDGIGLSHYVLVVNTPVAKTESQVEINAR